MIKKPAKVTPLRTEMTELEHLEKLIGDELDQWKKADLDPAGIQCNQFLLDTQVKAIIEYLEEKGILDTDELNIIYKKVTLRGLVAARQTLTPLVERARARANILGPDGERMQ